MIVEVSGSLTSTTPFLFFNNKKAALEKRRIELFILGFTLYVLHFTLPRFQSRRFSIKEVCGQQ